MTLTKRDLVVRISEETGLIQAQVVEVVQKTLDQIAEALARGDDVELRNFGVFKVRIAKPRTGRNPHKPEIDVAVPSRAIVKFRAGKEMRAEVLKLTPNGKEKAPGINGAQREHGQGLEGDGVLVKNSAKAGPW
jgi:nucleoid DNA-binding protein